MSDEAVKEYKLSKSVKKEKQLFCKLKEVVRRLSWMESDKVLCM